MVKGITLFFGAVLLFSEVGIATAVAQPLYGYRSGARGTVTFTSKKPVGKNYWVVKPNTSRYSVIRRSKGRGGWRAVPRASKFDGIIRQAATQHNLEPALVKAVIHAESSFRPDARSPKGAQGLMQLMPATAKRFGVVNPYKPSENISGGVRYLKWLYNHFDGNVIHVLAGYNAGENAVKRYKGVPPYSETRQYVKRVLKLRDLYRCDYAGRGACSGAIRGL